MEYFGAFFAAFFLRTFGFWITKRMGYNVARVLVASIINIAVAFGLLYLTSGLSQTLINFVLMQFLWAVIDVVAVLYKRPIVGTQTWRKGTEQRRH